MWLVDWLIGRMMLSIITRTLLACPVARPLCEIAETTAANELMDRIVSMTDLASQIKGFRLTSRPANKHLYVWGVKSNCSIGWFKERLWISQTHTVNKWTGTYRRGINRSVNRHIQPIARMPGQKRDDKRRLTKSVDNNALNWWLTMLSDTRMRWTSIELQVAWTKEWYESTLTHSDRQSSHDSNR